MDTSHRSHLPNSRSVRALSRRSGDRSLLASISLALASTRDLSELLDTLSRALLESVGCTASRIHLLDADRKSVTVRATRTRRGIVWDARGGNAIPVEDLAIHQWVISTQQPLVFSRQNAQTQLSDDERTVLFAPPFQNVLLVPLIAMRDCVGVAVLGEMRKWERSPFHQQKIYLAQAFADLAAHAIQNLRVLDMMVRRTEQLRILNENVADGILVVDREGRIQFANPAAERLLGYSTEQMMGRKFFTLTHPLPLGPDSSTSDYPLRDLAALHWEAPIMEFKESIVRGDGTSTLVNHRVAPIQGEDGRIEGVVSLIRDISQEEQELKLKSEFVSMVIHEVRAPLTNISGAANLLTDNALDPITKRKMAETINQECLRLSKIINDVLESSRIENGQFQVSPEPIPLLPLIQETVHAFQARNLQCRLEVSLPERPVFALGDCAWVQVILENLIQNAIDYSDSGRKVTVCADELDGQVKVSVTDEGIGIPQDQLASVFDKFHRVQSKGHPVSGFGLGLYLSKLLVEALGGSIGVESQLGRGSVFYFTLKACTDDTNQDLGD